MLKRLNNRLLFGMLVASFLLVMNSCRDKNYIIAKANVPIYQEKADWRNTTFELETSSGPAQSGKIYLYNDMLLVVEPYHGVHFYDNANTSSPVLLGWVPILACTDVSVRNNVLYANSYTDLIALDITDLSNLQVVDRIEDAFEFSNYTLLPGYNPDFPIAEYENNDEAIIGWAVQETELPTQTSNYGYESLTTSDALASYSEFGNSYGIGGSMAQFTLVGDYLYTLIDNELESYELEMDGAMNNTSKVQIQRTCETLFGTQDYLFMGTTSGMLAYDISNPSSPSFTSDIDHVTSCDPVVVSGNRAYITLSAGSGCWGVNQLEVINIDDVQNPSVISQYSMENPKGLGVESNLLFVCDGTQGVKVFDRTDDQQITTNLLTTLPVTNALDVIPHNKNLIITAEDGVYQFDYQDISNIYQTSHIPLNP